MASGFHLGDMLSREEPKKLRKLQYELREKGREYKMTMAQVENNLLNWSLTTGVHPWRFGIQFEVKGMIDIGENLEVRIEHCRNPFDITERTKTTFTGVECHPVPMITNVRVTRKEGRNQSPWAVIVVEHQNTTFDEPKLRSKWQNAIIIRVHTAPESA